MKCEEFKHLISSYIEGDCLQKQEFERHRNECAECRREFEETKKMIELLSSMEEVPLPEGFEQRLHQRLVMEGKPKKNIWFNVKRHKHGFAVGAAVIAASLVFVATPFFKMYDDSTDLPQLSGIGGVMMNLPAGGDKAADPVPGASAQPENTQPGMEGAVITQQPAQTRTPEAQGGQPGTVTITGRADGQSGANAGAGAETVPSGTPAPAQTTNQPQQQKQPPAKPSQNKDTGDTGAVDHPVAQPGGGQTRTPGEIGRENAKDPVGVQGVMTTGLDRPSVKLVSASAANRQWVQEHASAYDSRQTVEGVEVITLTKAEYQALENSGIAAESPESLPEGVQNILQENGYYVVLDERSR